MILIILLGFLPWLVIKGIVEGICEARGLSKDATKAVTILYWIIVLAICIAVEE